MKQNLKLESLANSSGLTEAEKHDLYQIFNLSTPARQSYLIENFDEIIDLFAYYRMQEELDKKEILEQSLERIQLKVYSYEQSLVTESTRKNLNELKAQIIS